MKIGIFTDTYEPQINGVVTSIQASIEYLSQNHEVFVFCPNVKEKLSSTDHVWRFPSVVYPFQQEYRLVLPFNKKVKQIKTLDLDILHIHTPFTMGNIGLRIGREMQAPIIHTYHTYFEKYLHYFPILPEKWVYKYAKRESERFCNQCNLIIVPSEEMNKQLSTYKINCPIKTIPSGINHYQPSEQEIKTFDDAHKVSGKTTCVFIGRLGFEKNIYFLIDAFERLLLSYPDLHLLIIGDGPEKKALLQIIASKKLSTNITVTGYLSKPDVFTALHRSKLMLFPSKTETQGLTVVESLLCGTPVIGLNQMGVKDMIGNNNGGILTSESIPEYVNAASSLLSNESVYSEQVEKAKERGREFSNEKTSKLLEDTYKKIITNHN